MHARLAGDLTGPPRDMSGRTATFASVSAQSGFQLGFPYRATDDLEALCYVLLYLHWGGLPWQDKTGDEMLAAKSRFVDWLRTAVLDSDQPPPPEFGLMGQSDPPVAIFRMLKRLTAVASERSGAVPNDAYAIFGQPAPSGAELAATREAEATATYEPRSEVIETAKRAGGGLSPACQSPREELLAMLRELGASISDEAVSALLSWKLRG